MNKLAKIINILSTVIVVTVASINGAFASGLLTAKGDNTDLQIQDHNVSVSIEDGYAITSVENTFYNPSANSLEAVYEFPIPKNGTVVEFTVWINGSPIIGEVVEKERAKQLYEQEKAAGRDAGLTEKVLFHRFESRVSPVLPQQTTRTRLVYMQAADVEGGIGRYVYPLEEGGTDQEKLDFWQTNSKVQNDFSFDLNLRSGFPIDAVRAPAHPHAVVANSDGHNWNVSINKTGKNDTPNVNGENTANAADKTEGIDSESIDQRAAAFSDLAIQDESLIQTNSLNQDLVVYWRLQPNLPGAIELVTHKEPGSRRGTFMLSVTPGVDLQPITEGRDWVFVLDRSGSMSGKYQTLMDATAQALSKLQSNDRFRVVLFSNHVEELTSDWTNADQISVKEISNALNRSQPDGGTDLYKGLKTAIKKLDSDRTSSIVLITDGVANVGKTEKSHFLDLMSKHDIRLFTAIMGNGANRPLLDSMTKISKGFATSISNSDDIMGVMLGAIEKVKYEALHDVDLKIKGLKVSDIVPEQPTTLYRGQQMVMFGHYFGDEMAEVVLSAKVSGEKKEYRSQFVFPSESTENPEIERLWAYAQIQELKNKANYLGTSTKDYQSAIVDTALEYGLVTDFTSMLVMSDEQFEANGIERTNRNRRTTEEAAKAQRKNNPVTTNRVDQNKPAFNGNQPSYSGGSGGSGAINPFALFMLLPLLFAWMRKRALTTQ